MNEKLNIQDLIELLAEKHGMSKKDAESFVKEFFLLVEESLETDKYVKIRGLGTFKLINVENRESININTGERFEIQGHTKVSFTPEPVLKDLINKPFSYFETVALGDETVLEDTPVESIPEDEGVKEEEIKDPVEEVTADVEEVTAEIEEEPVENSMEEPMEIVEPAVQEEEQVSVPDTSSASVKTTNDSTMKFFIGIVIFVVLLCAGAVVFMYYPDLFDRFISPTEKVADERTKDINPVVAEADTVAEVVALKPDTVTPEPVVKEEIPVTTPKKEKKKAVAAPFEPDSVNYKIVGIKTTYTIKEGETLTRVSLRFYGTKALWPYIVKSNPGVIKNPDKVPYGTVIKIPELVKK